MMLPFFYFCRMYKTILEVEQMDYPSEENLIRLKLVEISTIAHLSFGLPNRRLTIFHSEQIDKIEQLLIGINLGAKKISTVKSDLIDFTENTDQRTVLWLVLGINFVFFIIEIATCLISKSMGLVADSLDMLADSFVYGISLFAIGGTIIKKRELQRLLDIFK